MATMGSLLTISEFAKREGVSPQAIHKAIKKGRIRADKYYDYLWLIHPRESLKKER